MKDTNKIKRPLHEIAKDLFTYLGSHLPQQCGSDEFYFLPRAEAAIHHLNSLDALTPERIQDHIRYVQNLLNEISPEQGNDLEGQIDRHLLTQSMQSFIREFSDAQVWRNDPTLYIKIPLFATDQVISQKTIPPEVLKPSLIALFAQIPSFLSVAITNLDTPSEASLSVAIDMARDALNFYRRDIQAFVENKIGRNKELLRKNIEVVEAWAHFNRELKQLPTKRSFAIGEDGLRRIIAISLSYPKSPKEILEIARNAFQKTQEKHNALARKIDRISRRNGTLKERTCISSPEQILQLYKREVEELRRFFHSQDIITFPKGEKVAVRETPIFLKSLRATASYKAPLTGDTKDHGTFYITPGKDDLELIARHCPYLSAHETYPGHHILDNIRIHHVNPLRRQAESPLFYEGWACYSEQLLDELGYIQDPRQQIIQLSRQLWRCMRALLDVELHTEKVTLAQAAKKIQSLGFSSKRAQRQIRRFCLTPGYQLCYFMGTYEIMRLRKKFSSRMGLRSFHDTLLGGGEIPFHLVEKRMEAAVKRKS